MATPLLFELFNAIDYNSAKSRIVSPEDLDFRLVCSESGMLPEDNCLNRVIDYYIPQVTSIRRCDHLKKVFINSDSTFSYCTSCLPANGYKTAESVSYTHLTLPTSDLVQISVVAVSLKKKTIIKKAFFDKPTVRRQRNQHQYTIIDQKHDNNMQNVE